MASPFSVLGIAEGIGSIGLSAGKAAWKAKGLLGGYPMGMAIGSTAAGVGSFLTSDNQNMNIRLREAANAAALGGIAGLAGIGILRQGYRMASRSFSKQGAKDLWGSGKRAWSRHMAAGATRAEKVWGANAPISSGWAAFHHSGIGRSLRAPGQIAAFAINHPMVTAGVIGGAVIGSQYLGNSSESPALSGVTTDIEMSPQYNQQVAAADAMREVGIAPMGVIGTPRQMFGPSHGRFMNSTHGLAQGLHRGRHG